TSSAIYSDSVMCALSLWALERMMAWRESGGTSRLLLAIALIGLAAGAKYPAAALLIPLAWVMVDREGWRALRAWPAAAFGSLVVFLGTTPYAIHDHRAFLRDFVFEKHHAATGHFGGTDSI